MSKHTPGPWCRRKDGRIASNADLIIRNAGSKIAYAYRPRGMETR